MTSVKKGGRAAAWRLNKVRLYHRTNAAGEILAAGFLDATGTYGLSVPLTDVWVSDVPLDVNEGADGDGVLEIVMPTEGLCNFEIVEDGKGYREWCVPAALLNERGTVRLLDEVEVDDICIRWLRLGTQGVS